MDKKFLDHEPIAIGDSVCLRKITIEDTNDIIRWRNHADVRKKFISQELFTKEKHEEWLRSNVDTGKAIQMIICDLQKKKPIGTTYVRDIDKIFRKGEFGIFIGEKIARGKGIGNEVTMLMCDYVFKTIKLHKIYLRVFEDNIQARRCYEKAGFAQEGHLHDEVFIDDKPKDIILMAKFNPFDR